MESSQVTKPVFPPEIWPPIFSNLRQHDDLVHLWTDCRHVCRQFKDDIERVFRIKHLTKTTISFDCGRSTLKRLKMNLADAVAGVWYNPEAFGGKVNLRCISFGLGRLENEGETAVFSIEDCAEEYMSEIMRRVSYCIATSSIEHPGHIVTFRRASNDTEVTDLVVDERSREIRLNWRAIFSQFFAEDKLHSYYMQYEVGCLVIFASKVSADMFQLYDSPTGISEAQEHRDKVDRGEIHGFESLKAAMTFYMRAFDKGKKLARRARIRRQWEAEGQDGVFDEDFERGERAALGMLKEVAFANNFLEFSDDEMEEAAESVSRRKETTAEGEDEEDDENAWYESDEHVTMWKTMIKVRTAVKVWKKEAMRRQKMGEALVSPIPTRSDRQIDEIGRVPMEIHSFIKSRSALELQP